MVVKSATKKKIMGLGIAEEFSHKLADDRKWDDVKVLTSGQIAQICGIDSVKAQEIYTVMEASAKPSKAAASTDESEEYEEVPSRLAEFVRFLREVKESGEYLDKEVEEDTPLLDKKDEEDTHDEGDGDSEQVISWKKWIVSEHKIGNIMDGQHRIWGLKGMNPEDCDHLTINDEPRCSVTLIPDMKKAEQVFHFAMMNMTPEKVKPGLARGNAIYSLTGVELDEYEERMDRFMLGLEAKWIRELSENNSSPFKGKVSYDYMGDDSNFVKERILLQIAQKWYNASTKNKKFGKMYKGATAWNDDSEKMKFRLWSFYSFWNKIMQHFEDDWGNMNSNIWKKVSLWVLQDFLRIKINQSSPVWTDGKKAPFDDLASLESLMVLLLKNFPKDFFKHPWNHVDDTSDGRAYLLEQMEGQYGSDKVHKTAKLFSGAGS